MKTIGDALREFADEQEHQDYFYDVRIVIAAFLDQPALDRTLALMQARADELHNEHSLKAGRRLRRIHLRFDRHQGKLDAIVEPIDPDQPRQPWPPTETTNERSEN